MRRSSATTARPGSRRSIGSTRMASIRVPLRRPKRMAACGTDRATSMSAPPSLSAVQVRCRSGSSSSTTRVRNGRRESRSAASQGSGLGMSLKGGYCRVEYGRCTITRSAYLWAGWKQSSALDETTSRSAWRDGCRGAGELSVAFPKSRSRTAFISRGFVY